MKGFKMFLMILLSVFSFYYTDRVMNFINMRDPLMEKLNVVSADYEVKPVNAVIVDDTIIPGIKGVLVDTKKSYEEMRLSGIFREDALVYKDVLPNCSVSNNINKYIVKGSKSNSVSLIVILNMRDIDKISNINKITIFLNHKDITSENINRLKKREVYTYGNNGIYDRDVLNNDNLLINSLSGNKSNYCLLKEKNSDYLNACNYEGMMVVIPNIIGGYNDIKNSLSGGSIILVDDIRNIDYIVKYIYSKGFDIVYLSELLSE